MAKQIHEVLQATELEPSPVLSEAYGAVVGSLVVVIDGLVHQIARLEGELAERFERHPDAEILRSLPGLGLVLGARVLAELGDDPTPYADAKARKSYAGTPPSPEPPASGWWSWLGWPATSGWPMPVTSGPSPPSGHQPELVGTTKPAGRPARPITKRSEPWPTGSWVFSMGASNTASLTEKTWPGRRGLKRWLDSFQSWDV